MRKQFVVLAVVASVLAVTAPLAAATTTYEVTGADSIDVPEQTISIGGDEFQVTSVSTLERGEMIEANVTAGDDSSRYSVGLFNTDKQTEHSTTPRSGDSTVEFTTDELSPGTYILGVDDSGFQAIHPIVIQGYDVSVDAPETVTAGETVDVTVELTAREDNPPVDAVEVALIDDSVVAETTASEDGEHTYSATITAPESAGTYQLGTIVRGPDEIESQNEKEVVAASDPMELTVESSDDDDDGNNGSSDTSGSSGSGDSSGSSSGSDGTTDSGETTATPTATPNATATETATGTPTTTDGDGTPETAGQTATSDDADGPIQPAGADNGSDNASADTPGERGGLGVDGPGFLPVTAILALLGATELIRRRR